MQFQEQKVLLSQRWNPFVQTKAKEWWYTGISDESQRLFIGISAIRTKFIDSIDISVYFGDAVNQNAKKDNSGGHWEQAAFIGLMKCGKEENKLDLSINRNHSQKSFYFDYTDIQGSEDESDSCKNTWSLNFSSNKKNCSIRGNFEIRQKIPRFTKYDNFFCNEYTLLHYFKNTVSGTLIINEKEYKIENGLGYQDHCYGTVPSKTKWHWIAVQGEKCALASLMNYGPYAQQYTEAYFGNESTNNNWVRLNQNVSFECYGNNRFQREWQITSPDMNLKCEILSWNNQNNWIPPIVNLKHYECYVKVEGLIKLNNECKETGAMYGVLEEHYGKW